MELYLWFSIIVSHPSEDGGGRGGLMYMFIMSINQVIHEALNHPIT